jgi:hypothetical protein
MKKITRRTKNALSASNQELYFKEEAEGDNLLIAKIKYPIFVE